MRDQHKDRMEAYDYVRIIRFQQAILLALVLGSSVPLSAELPADTNAPPVTLDPKRLTGGGGVGSRALASQVNDPTSPVTLFQFRNVTAPRVPGYDSPANVLQLEPVFPIFPSRLLPFEQLVKMTLPIPTTPNPGSQTGLGDFSLFDVATFRQSWGKWGLGPALVFPTATSAALGQDKWQAGPAVAAIYTGMEGLTAGLVLQNPVSFAGDPDRPAVNNLVLTPTLTYNLPRGWFAGYSDFEWVFDWRNGGRATIPVGVQAGKIFTAGSVPVSLSLEGAWFPVRPDSFPEWSICFELTIIFKTKRSPH